MKTKELDTKELIKFLKVGLYNLDYTNPKTCRMFKKAEREIIKRLEEHDKITKRLQTVSMKHWLKG